MLKIIGVQNCKGEYEGYTYDKVTFHTQVQLEQGVSPKAGKELICGIQTYTFSVKRANLPENINLGNVVGKIIEPVYDRFGRPSSVIIK